MYSDSTFNGSDFIVLGGMSNVLICNNEANVASKQVEFPKGYDPTTDNNLSFKVIFMNGDYGDSSSHTLNLNGLDVYVYQYGQLVLLPNHNLTISSVNGYYTLQKGTVLELYYNPDVGGNTEGWVVIGNPVVLSSASYTIYADGLNRVNEIKPNNMGMPTAKAVFDHVDKHVSIKDWLESNNYDLFANTEPGSIAVRAVHPGNMISQGVPSGFSGYGNVVLFKPDGNANTALMLYIDVFCKIARWNFDNNIWATNT